MTILEINDIIINGVFDPLLFVGITKDELEKRLGKSLGEADIKTPDLSLYFVELEVGIVLTLHFDNQNICYDMELDLEENKKVNLVVRLGQDKESITEDLPFEKLIFILFKLCVEWEFDRGKIYMQTICIRLKNGLRFYYAFGSKDQNDYGLFSIKMLLENHNYNLGFGC